MAQHDAHYYATQEQFEKPLSWMGLVCAKNHWKSCRLEPRFSRQMNDPVANTQLELACRLGVLDEVIEALDDGANINYNGGSPLFFAIESGNEQVLGTLVERGADVTAFGIGPEAADAVQQLMAIGSPSSESNAGASEEMVELDAKMIRAFNRMLCNKGMADPIKKGRLAEYAAFADGLKTLAAEECCAVVSEFLEWIKPGDDVDAEEAAKAVLADDENADRLGELGEKYLKASEEEQPGELLKDYVKERKKKM